MQIDTLPNLEIPAFIGEKVAAAEAEARAAVISAMRGNYTSSVAHARAARVAAEVVATHHSIVSQHSYPEQHKVALYLPLFAPLLAPVLGALSAEVRRAVLPRSWRQA